MVASQVFTVAQDLLDQLRGAWRFRWIALAVAWCVAVALWIVVFLIPNTYQASARVFVDARTTLSEATQGISLGDDIASQIQRVRQALLGVPQLQKVAEETNLLAGAVTPQAKQLVIDKLRKDIDITGGLSANSPSAAVFIITYKNYDRAKSLQVVDRLLNTFVEGSLGGKREGSEQAQQFLIAQIADYERMLSTDEQRLADFKKRNVGLMPGAQGDYFTRLQTQMDGLSKAKEDLGLALRKRDELQRQLHGEQPFVTGSAPAGISSLSATATSDVAESIRQTQQRLDDLLLRFTDNHPDVIAAREQLKELKARQQAEIAAAQRGDVSAAAQMGLAANPVYQNIELQYNQVQVDIASMQQDISDREKKITALRTMMNTAPEVEAQLSKLNRDYDVTRTQYKALLERLDRARLGEQAAATGIVKFEVIDPPTAKFEPISPKRPLLIVASLIAAIAAGTGSAYLLHLLRPVFVSTRQLGAVTGATVIGAVSMAWLEKHQTVRRRASILYVCGAAALAVVGVAVLILQAHIFNVVRELLV